MNILAIDTSSEDASAALRCGDGRIKDIRLSGGRSCSAELMSAVKRLTEECGADKAEIDIYAVTEGPGSFTGLRIGMCTAKALAYAAGKKLVTVSTLETAVCAYCLSEKQLFEASAVLETGLKNGVKTESETGADARNVCALIYARNDQVYRAEFILSPSGCPIPISSAAAGSILEALDSCKQTSDTIFVGDGAFVHRDTIIKRFGAESVYIEKRFSGALAAAWLAEKKALKGEFADIFTAVPEYLRKSQAERTAEGENQNGGGIIK